MILSLLVIDFHDRFDSYLRSAALTIFASSLLPFLSTEGSGTDLLCREFLVSNDKTAENGDIYEVSWTLIYFAIFSKKKDTLERRKKRKGLKKDYCGLIVCYVPLINRGCQPRPT